MAEFTHIDALAAGIALAFVVVVWAMHPSIGATRGKGKPHPLFKARGVDASSTRTGEQQ